MENTTETEAILAAGVAISKNVGVLKDGTIPFTVVPDGYKEISELSETKLSVAVFGPGPANGPESSSSLFQPQSNAFVSSQGS